MLEFTTQEYPQHELLKQYQSDALPENEVSEFIKSLVDEYYTNSLMNHHSVKDSAKMNILIKDLGNSLLDKNTLRRDSIIFENYVHQKQLSHFNSHLQFVRMEVYHMMKMNFDNMYPGFLGMLINKNIYHPSEIYPVLGIL